MRLLLIRHGQTPSNVDGLLDTSVPGPGLTELGRAQAEHLPTTLAGESIDAIVASTLVRTQDTAAPLATERGLPVRIEADLREVGAGELEMRGDLEARRTYLETIRAWAQGDLTPRLPGGDPGAEVLARLDRVTSLASTLGSTVVLIGHGAAVRLWLAARVSGVTDEHTLRAALPNTGLVTVEGGPGAWTFRGWSEPQAPASATGPAAPVEG